MIDRDFITTYTNALYTTKPENAPQYDEFRDMFSTGQLLSKEWAVNTLYNLGIVSDQNVLIAGSWFGTLGLMLHKMFPEINIRLLDIDMRCAMFLCNLLHNIDRIRPITDDMYLYNYTEDLVINTSCEHIEDVRGWINLLPEGTKVLLQSNNYAVPKDHVNCVFSTDEFLSQTNLAQVLYFGKLEMPMYTRYMIIGVV